MRTEKVVEGLRKLPDGWGGSTTKKPTTKAVRKIKKILSTLESGRMPWPVITAVATGGLILTWVSLTRDILMTIDQDGDVQFITSMKKVDIDTAEVMDRIDSEGPISDMLTIDYMMSWFCQERAATC